MKFYLISSDNVKIQYRVCIIDLQKLTWKQKRHDDFPTSKSPVS